MKENESYERNHNGIINLIDEFKKQVPLQQNLETYVLENFLSSSENQIVQITVSPIDFCKAIPGHPKLWVNLSSIEISCFKKDFNEFLNSIGQKELAGEEEIVDSIEAETCIEFISQLKRQNKFYEISFEELPSSFLYNSHSSDYESAENEVKKQISQNTINRALKAVSVTMNAAALDLDFDKFQNFIKQFQVNRDEVEFSVNLKRVKSAPLVKVEMVYWPDIAL